MTDAKPTVADLRKYLDTIEAFEGFPSDILEHLRRSGELLQRVETLQLADIGGLALDQLPQAAQELETAQGLRAEVLDHLKQGAELVPGVTTRAAATSSSSSGTGTRLKKAQVQELEAFILQGIRAADKPMSRADIIQLGVDQFGYPDASIHNVILRLKKDGKITNPERGVYQAAQS